MALFNCPECQQQVSTDAHTCPHCGFPIAEKLAHQAAFVASHPGTSAGLDEISLNPSSEHSDPGPTKTLAGIRIRLSGSDSGYASRATDHKVPQISLAAE